MLFFKSIIVIIFEIYFELLFIGLISFYTPKENLHFSFLTFCIGAIIFLIVAIIIPVTLIYVLSQPAEKLFNDPEFQHNWGMIYLEYKNKSKIEMSYRLVYCLRRILFISTILIFDRVPTA